MTYRFASLVKKVSKKGNPYARLFVLDLKGNVHEAMIYENLIFEIDQLNLTFGDYINIECDLRGIASIGLLDSESMHNILLHGDN